MGRIVYLKDGVEHQLHMKGQVLAELLGSDFNLDNYFEYIYGENHECVLDSVTFNV